MLKMHVGYVGELCHFPDFRVDIVKNLFTDFSEFTFCGIYEAACRVVCKVTFVVFRVIKAGCFVICSVQLLMLSSWVIDFVCESIMLAASVLGFL